VVRASDSRLPAVPLSGNLGQDVHTHTCHQAIILSTGQTAVTPCGWEGHASQTSVVYPPAYVREMSTPPSLVMGYGTLFLSTK